MQGAPKNLLKSDNSLESWPQAFIGISQKKYGNKHVKISSPSQTHIHREQTDGRQRRGGLGGWERKVEGWEAQPGSLYLVLLDCLVFANGIDAKCHMGHFPED